MNLSDFKYDEINAEFTILCRRYFYEFESIKDQEDSKSFNFIQQKEKNDIFKICSHIKNDIKKFISNLPVSKFLYEYFLKKFF